MKYSKNQHWPYSNPFSPIGNSGYSLKNTPALAKGVNVYKGKVTYQAVAEALGLEYTPLTSVW
jgi:alanine dehydrogenase